MGTFDEQVIQVSFVGRNFLFHFLEFRLPESFWKAKGRTILVKLRRIWVISGMLAEFVSDLGVSPVS